MWVTLATRIVIETVGSQKPPRTCSCGSGFGFRLSNIIKLEKSRDKTALARGYFQIELNIDTSECICLN